MVRPTHKESRVTRRMDEWRRWLPVCAFRCSARRTFHSTTVHRGWQVKDLEHAYTKTRAHTQQPFLINYSLFHVCILYSILRCVVIFLSVPHHAVSKPEDLCVSIATLWDCGGRLKKLNMQHTTEMSYHTYHDIVTLHLWLFRSQLIALQLQTG